MSSIVIVRNWKIPVAAAILMVCGAVLIYVMSVIRGDDPPWLPFISDAGGVPPESGIFSLYLVVTAIIIIFSNVAIYLATQDAANDIGVHTICKWAAICASLSGFGMFIVASNPVRSHPNSGSKFIDVVLPHMTGAVTAFGCGFAYMLLHTMTSIKLRARYIYPTSIIAQRIFCTAVSGTALILLLIAEALHALLDNSTAWTGFSEMLLSGNFWENVAALNEWITYFALALYVATLRWEFSEIKVDLSANVEDMRIPRTAGTLVNRLKKPVEQKSNVSVLSRR